MESDIRDHQQALQEMAELLQPWWQHLGSIDDLVTLFMSGGNRAFQRQLSAPESAP
jgi:hypothetical protein